jgi:phage terminase large subunit-like protein
MRPSSAWTRLSPADQVRLLALAELELAASPAGAASEWLAIARPDQLPPPGSWRIWLILAGRGWGKTRTGAETIALWVREGLARRIAIVAQTGADGREISVRALLAAFPGARYEPSRRLVTFPNGAEAVVLSAEVPDGLRGHEFDTAWVDELAAWRHPEALHQILFGLRVGWARLVVTTTPRPVPIIQELRNDPRTVVTHGRTVDNAANLASDAVRDLLSRYGNTPIGRQELDAEILDDIPGALWNRSILDACRVTVAPEMVRIVVAVDPAVTSRQGADETGIVVAGKGVDGHGYVLEDLSCRASPHAWARIAIGAFHTWNADRIVAEANQGGDLLEIVLRTVDQRLPYRAVHASQGKRARAEPVAALYERRRVHHVGVFRELEDQLCSALPEGGSGPDDRLDALVHALTELGLTGSPLDVPGVIYWQYNMWPCPCGIPYYWEPLRRCPNRSCGRVAPPTYDEPVDPATLV